MLCIIRFEDIDPETGIEITQNFSGATKDIYPIHIVENKDGIQGSCALYKQRKDITKHVRSTSLTPLVNLQEAMERFVVLYIFIQVLRQLFCWDFKFEI